MIDHPKTKAEAVAYWKGCHFGMGHYIENQCVYSVHEDGRSVGFRQCQQKPGFGPEGLYCKRHAKEFEEKKAVATWYRVSRYNYEVEAVPVVGFTETRVDLGKYTEKRSNDGHVWLPSLKEVEAYLLDHLKSIRQSYEKEKKSLETVLVKLEKKS